jgi:uncharacterized phage protein (TIGR01671 family)
MSEIKFRVWDYSKKKIYQVSSIHFFTLYISVKIANGGSYRSIDIEYNNVLMQYTGLKDVNGKEIYEGDIVRHRQLGFGDPIEVGVIVCGKITRAFSGGGYWIRRINNLAEESEGLSLLLVGEEFFVEVIGNLYQNPELHIDPT